MKEQTFPIDITRFKELSDDDADSLLELLQLYLSKTFEQVEELQKAVETKTLPTIARLAHSMIGANAMVGMNDVVPLLRTLEEYAEKNEMNQAQRVFANVQKEFERIQSGLKDHVKSLSHS